MICTYSATEKLEPRNEDITDSVKALQLSLPSRHRDRAVFSFRRGTSSSGWNCVMSSHSVNLKEITQDKLIGGYSYHRFKNNLIVKLCGVKFLWLHSSSHWLPHISGGCIFACSFRGGTIYCRSRRLEVVWLSCLFLYFAWTCMHTYKRDRYSLRYVQNYAA